MIGACATSASDVRRWLASAAALVLAALATAAGAAAPARNADAAALQIVASATEVDLWPAVTLQPDPGGALGAADVAARPQAFAPPNGPHANLGPRREAVWLRVPLHTAPGARADWLLDIDYPPLDRVDVYLMDGDVPQWLATLGDSVPFAERAVPARPHVAPLRLPPGQPQVLLLRVQTTSSMVLPLRLMTQQRFDEREARVQMWQGLLAGIGLCLLIYSLAHWLSLRDASFLYYALSVASITLFFFGYYGLGPQHLWGGSAWLTANMPPFIVLLALVGGLPFLERTLRVSELHHLAGRLMNGLAVLAALVAAAFALGLLDYRGAQLAGTVLGPTPIVLGLPAAYLRARRGDLVARYVLLGWTLYAVGIVTMAALLRGMVGINLWTHYAFQAGAVAEMVIWMRVLGVRIGQLRHEAERAGREREAMQSLAHTDPLTGLPNRRGLELELAAALPRADSSRPTAVFLLDLDGFKAVNDRLGHEGGDELLKGVAQRLRANLRGRDVVARLGGDEFVVMAAELTCDADALRLGQKLLEAFRAPFAVGQDHCHVGLTIGYALAPQDGSDPAALLRRADEAMYAGKQAGKHCVQRLVEPVAAA